MTSTDDFQRILGVAADRVLDPAEIQRLSASDLDLMATLRTADANDRHPVGNDVWSSGGYSRAKINGQLAKDELDRRHRAQEQAALTASNDAVVETATWTRRTGKAAIAAVVVSTLVSVATIAVTIWLDNDDEGAPPPATVTTTAPTTTN